MRISAISLMSVLMVFLITMPVSSNQLTEIPDRFLPNAPFPVVEGAGEARSLHGKNYVPGQILVGFKPSKQIPFGKRFASGKDGIARIGVSTIDALSERFGAHDYSPLLPKHPTNLRRIYKVKLSKNVTIESAVEAYSDDPNVEYAEPNWIYDVCLTPGDGDLTALWGLEKMECFEAWDISTGDSSVVIAVIDTGVDWNHPDLEANIWTNADEIPGNGDDDDENGYDDDIRGWDFVSVDSSAVYSGEDAHPPDNDPMDFAGHGTHVAGIAAAVANNDTGLEHNVVGVAWQCKIMALRAGYKNTVGKGVFEYADWCAALAYAADNRADVVNMSFRDYNTAHTGMIFTDYALSKGCVLVAAAGNDQSSKAPYPAKNIGVIAVAATDSTDRKAWFSNYGEWVDVSAPGVSILSTFFDNDYKIDQGTSMAAPYVAGLVALLRSVDPTLTPDEIASRIKDSADNIDHVNPDYEGKLGSGRINAYAALSNDISGHKPSISNPIVNPLRGTESQTFEFLVDYYDSDGDPPFEDYKKLVLPDGRDVEMILKPGSGTASNGTYYCTTTFSKGNYYHCFSFADTTGQIATTPWYDGPYVYEDGDVPINIEIKCSQISQDLELEYSLVSNTGPWTDIPITNQFLDPLIVPPASQIWFHASVASANYEFQEWNLYENGSWIDWGSNSIWGITLGTNTTSLDLDVRYGYTPQNYTISGTVLRSDSTPVQGGVELLLTSSQQTMTQTSNDGNFSFTGVDGGVSVTITPSADGYAFSPSGLVFNNLNDDQTGKTIVAYPSDTNVPSTSFGEVPPVVCTESSVTFSWTGQDDTTDTANLLYQYKLDGIDIDWSVWNASTSKSYDLPNGVYTFWVRAKDEAENINQAPVSYPFVVNAAPRIATVARITQSIWASRVTIEMPTGASHPTDTFVLLPEHSGMSDFELVPVRIHRADEIAPCGANEIVAAELGLTARISKVGNGWLVTLPDSIPSGQTVQYDIVWGKIQYFGWQEYVTVSQDFPNLGAYGSYLNCHIDDSFLDENHSIWRLASKIYRPGFHWDGQFAWTMMNASSHNGTVIPERTIRFLPGIPWDGSYAEIYETNCGEILKAEQNVCYLWQEEKYVKEDIDGDSEYYRYHNYVIRSYDSMGNLTGSFDSEFLVDTWHDFAKEPIGNYLWIVGDSWNVSSTDLWFTAHDFQGNRVIPMTTFESASTGYIDSYKIRSIADKVIFLFEQSWNTPENDDRRRIYYQIRDINGNLIKDTTELNPPLLPDSVEQDDEYDFESTLTDNDGKVWICFQHKQPGLDEYYYSVIGEDGNLSKGPILLSAERQFRFCDKDGYIWATENGQFFALNPDDTIAVAPRTLAWTPSQRVGQIAADASSTGYRLYDRWSPQLVQIDVPSGANANSMELFDLNVWDNDLHPTNLSLKKGETSVWSQSGQFTSHTTVDISGTLSEGANILTMTQDDFLGGQVLVTFPYVKPSPIIKGDINSDDNVDLTDAILALQVMAGIEPSATVHKEADVNGDNKIGIEEVIYILQKVTGLR